ncbi:MAG TPA: NrfD/PsrC family molybdoenzyme membrane anchor subunit, partial [Longimicrobiales bacterium]|nr:NrfD/PsrC family molybdoenzyme membrane anchor subunit [Longimicrobiales bacterium]
MNEFLSTRGNALVDPGLHVWHGEVAAYLFLGGLVAGVMVMSGLLLLRSGGGEDRSTALALLPWTAPILLSVGMFFLWLDLENPWNAVRFYFVFRPSSVMSWGAWILLAIYPASILLAWRTTPHELRRAAVRLAARAGSRVQGWAEAVDGWVDARTRAVALVNVAFGVGLGVYTGLLLGTMAARPLWNSAILGPLFLTSGLSTGAAFMLLYKLADGERRLLGRLDMGLIAGELILLAIWLIGLTTGGAASRSAAALFLGGPYTAAFWTLVVALGLVVPLAGE